LVGAEPDDTVGADAAELAVDLLHGDAGPEREADQPPDGLDIRHQRTAGLAEAHEDLERLALVVFGDVDVEGAERRLHPAGSAAQHLGAGALLAAVEVLRLQLMHQLPEPAELGLRLRQLAPEIGLGSAE